MRWRLFLEEYSPDIQWLEGESNVVADALSRLPYNHTPLQKEHYDEELLAHHYCYTQHEIDKQLYPLKFKTIEKYQLHDKALMKELTGDKYDLASFHGGEGTIELICHKGKIVVPTVLQPQIVEWYHLYLWHPGKNRTKETIRQHFW